MITKVMITAPPDTPGRDDHEIWLWRGFRDWGWVAVAEVLKITI